MPLTTRPPRDIEDRFDPELNPARGPSLLEWFGRLPRPIRRLAVLWLACACVLAILTAAYVASGGQHGPAPIPGAPSTDQGRTAVGVPIGYRHTRDGAYEAAANYLVALNSPAMYAAATRGPVLSTVLDPAVRPGLEPVLDAGYTLAARGYGLDSHGTPATGGQFVARAVPVGQRLVSYRLDTAVVAVWNTGLVGVSGTGSRTPVEEAWSTDTVTLHWVDNDWRWASSTHADGPVPVVGTQNPSSADALLSTVQGLGGYRYATP